MKPIYPPILLLSFALTLTTNSQFSFADAGRGSIRAAARPEPAPRAAEHAAPARVEPAHAEPQRPEPARVEPAHVEPARVEPARVEKGRPDPEAHPPQPPARAAGPARRDWDDNDEDARHFGPIGRGAPVHIVRGQRFHDLPPHHIDIPFRGHHYFLDDVGIFYVLDPDGEYVCVQPPVGIAVTSLPEDAQPITVGPTTYYYLDGMFYVAQGDGFAVVAPPSGIIVSSLPTGATQTVINGAVVYQFDGFNYAPSIQDGVTVYTVTPS